MNVIEKILASKSGKSAVEPEDVVVCDVDLMVMHDLSANFVMKVFENEMDGGGHRRSVPHRVCLRSQFRAGDARGGRGSGCGAQVRCAASYSQSLRQRLRQHSPCDHGSRPRGPRHGHHRLRLAYPDLRRARRLRHRHRQQLHGGAGLRPLLGLVQGSRRRSRSTCTATRSRASMRATSRSTWSAFLGEDGAIYKAIEYAGRLHRGFERRGPRPVPAAGYRRRRQVRLHQPGRQDRRVREGIAAGGGVRPVPQRSRHAATPRSSTST